MKKITYPILIAVLLVSLYSCEHKENENLELDFCKMHKEDQMYTDYEGKSEAERLESSKKRRHLFEKNFDLLIKETQKRGFPNVSYWDYPMDTCKYWAVNLTIIHTMQAHPEKLFEPQIVELLKKEIDNGNKVKEHINSAFIISSKTNEFCKQLKDNIENATKLWGIKNELTERITYKEC